jgi:NACHT domain
MELFTSSAGNVLLGVIGNVLTEILFHYFKKDSLPTTTNLYQPLALILQKAIAKVVRNSKYGSEEQFSKLSTFLISPEVEAIIRQIYANKLINNQGDHIEEIRKEFVVLLALNFATNKRQRRSRANDGQQVLPWDRANSDDIANEIFSSILESCELALQISIERGILSAHEAKSTFRFQILHDELATINKNITFLMNEGALDLQAISSYEEKYRQQIPSRHGYITPPNFDTVKKLQLDMLYVCPNFTRVRRQAEDSLNTLDFKSFCKSLYRVVLLGNPGGGKSTFTDKLCNDMASNYESRMISGRRLTPVHVILRDYGAAKKNSNYSILEFIQLTAVSKYQLNTPPKGAFEYLLLNGHVAVIFDGLDELLDTSFRQTISGDVESFCALYPSVPVLVTSREVGYHEAPLDEEKFVTFRLDSFDDNLVKTYVTKWFSTIEVELEQDQRDKKIEAFMSESQAVSDLRSNPLMLALLCNIYRGQGYIPRNRPDVYEKCAVMLFERWDRSRGIQVTLAFESRIIFAMMYLAHWIYTDQTLQGGVAEHKLVSKATEYLCQKQFEDTDEAEKAAIEFIAFCRGRAWVFTDTGTMRDGERLYQFTHRTFLEYFAARHLVRISRNTDSLKRILLPKILRREWDAVAQLAFKIQDKQTEGSGDALILSVLGKANGKSLTARWNLLCFAGKCLEFMVPSPQVKRKIVTQSVDLLIEMGLQRLREDNLSNSVNRNALEILLCGLLNSAVENQATVADELKNYLIKKIHTSDVDESFISYEIGYHLYFPIIFDRDGRTRKESLEFWQGVSAMIFKECSNQIINELSPKYYRASIDCLCSGNIKIESVIKQHGIAAIFDHTSYVAFSNVSTIPYIINSLDRLFDFKNETSEWSIYSARLSEFGQFILSAELPFSTSNLGIITNEKYFQNSGGSITSLLGKDFAQDIMDSIPVQSKLQMRLDATVTFSVFCSVAIYLEIFSQGGIALKDLILNTSHPTIKRFQNTFLSQLGCDISIEAVELELDSVNLTSRHREFILSWFKREIMFISIQNSSDSLENSIPANTPKEENKHITIPTLPTRQ